MERMHGWVGRKDRHPVTLDAVIHREDGTRLPVRLSNYSEEGCRIEADLEFGIGERLQIAIPRMGKVKAQVRWAIAGSSGAKFLVQSDF